MDGWMDGWRRRKIGISGGVLLRMPRPPQGSSAEKKKKKKKKNISSPHSCIIQRGLLRYLS